jgi:hypothetical protein
MPRGRPQGAKNKTTVKANEAFDLAFVGIGGVPALIEWGQENPTDFYRIFSKRMSTDITSGDKPLQPTVLRVPIPMTADEWEAQQP